MAARCLVLDTETSDREPTEARLVTAYLGILDAKGNVEIEQEWLVRPDGYEIPEETTAIHGVSDAHAREHGVPLRDALEQIWAIITMESVNGSLPLVAMNMRYDATVLTREYERTYGIASDLFSRVDILDPYVLDKRIDRYRKGSRKLIDMAAHYGVELSEEDAHGARADAIAAGRVVQRILRHDLLSGMPLDVITEAQAYWAAEQAESLRSYFLREGLDDKAASVRTEWPVIPE